MDRRGAILAILAAVGALPAATKLESATTAPTVKGTGAGVSFRNTMAIEYPVEIRLTENWMHVTMTDRCKGFRITYGGQTCEVSAAEVMDALYAGPIEPKSPSPDMTIKWGGPEGREVKP